MAVAPNMWDPTCSTFLSCVNGAPVVRPCGPGTLWDDNLQTCNHADQVKCAPKCAGGAPSECRRCWQAGRSGADRGRGGPAPRGSAAPAGLGAGGRLVAVVTGLGGYRCIYLQQRRRA